MARANLPFANPQQSGQSVWLPGIGRRSLPRANQVVVTLLFIEKQQGVHDPVRFAVRNGCGMLRKPITAPAPEPAPA
jgi:hypothetical protein